MDVLRQLCQALLIIKKKKKKKKSDQLTSVGPSAS